MVGSSQKFAQMLSQAIRQIAVRDHLKIQIVQDELGYVLGRDTGGSAIEYWRKGHIPAKITEVEALARELVRRGGMTNQNELEQFLVAAAYPDPAYLMTELWRSLPQETLESSTNDQKPNVALPEEFPPFVVGPPITHPRYFFGRERELKRLFNLLKRRPLQNAAIIGPRRSGKTSLLHYLSRITTLPTDQLRHRQRADWLATPDRYRWIYVDFQDVRLGHRAGLLSYILIQLNLPVPEPCDLEQFFDVMSRELQQPTVILLDEIDVALQRHQELDDALWEGLRALATNQVGGNLAFVLASHRPPEQLAQQNDIGSPFFNIFGYTAGLGPLTEAEARTLIAASPQPLPADDVAWILSQSGRWPILLQILCRECLLALEEGEIGLDWRDEGLRQMAAFRYLLEA